MTTEIKTIYRAYTKVAADNTLGGYTIEGLQRFGAREGYTDDRYDQPAMYHNAIALIEAASDCRSINYEFILEGVGVRRRYAFVGCYQVDYYIDEEFLACKQNTIS